MILSVSLYVAMSWRMGRGIVKKNDGILFFKRSLRSASLRSCAKYVAT
jgi:hypothetical protein